MEDFSREVPSEDSLESPLERLKRELGYSDHLPEEIEVFHQETAGDELWNSLSQGESDESIDVITIDLRNLLLERKDILNPGSVDEALVRSLGIEVSISPALVEITIDEAKEFIRKSTGEVQPRVSVEDLVPAWKRIEQMLMEDRWNAAAESFVIAHAIKPEDAQALRQQEPSKLRSLARLLDAPIAVKLATRLAQESLEGKTYSIDEVMLRLAGIIKRYNRQQVALEEGDPTAIRNHHRLLIDNPAVAEAVNEMTHREEFETDKPNKNIPPQDEV